METVGETVKTETARQVVILVFTVATAALLGALADPGMYKTVKMKAAIKIRDGANRQAFHLLNLADKAQEWYERERI